MILSFKISRFVRIILIKISRFVRIILIGSGLWYLYLFNSTNLYPVLLIFYIIYYYNIDRSIEHINRTKKKKVIFFIIFIYFIIILS